jgi:hypothetical protein
MEIDFKNNAIIAGIAAKTAIENYTNQYAAHTSVRGVSKSPVTPKMAKARKKAKAAKKARKANRN